MSSRVDEHNYWKERVELLIDDKKKWMKEKKELRSKLNKLTDKI